MSRKALTLMLFVLAACGGSSQTASNSPAVSATPPAQLTPSATASANASLDPCQLVTQQEASQLAGATFGAGKPETISNGARMCTYGAQTPNVFMVEVAVASDAATAQADWAQEEAKAQAGLQQLLAEAGGNVTLNAGDISLSGADKAAAATSNATIGGRTISISAIYVLKGPVFFMFSNLVLGKQAPTTAQMEQQAQTVLTRI
jgi:hypothetical protein